MKITIAIVVLVGLWALVSWSDRQQEQSQKQSRSDPYYVGFMPLAQGPVLDEHIHQWKFTFSISKNPGDLSNSHYWRTAFFPENQSLGAPVGLRENEMYQIKVGDEVELISAVEGVTPEVVVSQTYFVLSIRKH